MRVLIAGGGIGGLTAALELHRVGIEVDVFESVPEIRALGVGINLLPHAVRILSELDLLPELRSTGIETLDLTYFNKFGQKIWTEPRGVAAGYKWPQFSIHRGELQMLLLSAVSKRLGTDRVHTNHHLKSFRETSDGKIEAHFIDRATGEDRGVYEGSALIGADGIQSTVRAKLYPEEGPPKWNGLIFWRGTVIAKPFLSGRSMFMAGYPDRKFIAYPISKKVSDESDGALALINWNIDVRVKNASMLKQEDWNRSGNINDFLHLFETWKFDWVDVPSLINGAKSVFEFPCVDRDPLDRWSFGRVTLLGDAAHPMYPMGSNGASQSIRDARALAEALKSNGDVPDALLAYDGVRRPATSQVVLSNRQSGPERVMAIAEDRAPGGFKDIHSVIPKGELEQIASHYKRLAGFDHERVNDGVNAL